MSADISDSHNRNGDGGSAAAAAAGHIAVQIAEGSADRQECRIPPDTDSAVNGSAATQQCAVDNTPADMGHTPASLRDDLLASDFLMDAGEAASDCVYDTLTAAKDVHAVILDVRSCQCAAGGFGVSIPVQPGTYVHSRRSSQRHGWLWGTSNRAACWEGWWQLTAVESTVHLRSKPSC